jgi:hypothetical protein
MRHSVAVRCSAGLLLEDEAQISTAVAKQMLFNWIINQNIRSALFLRAESS